MAPLAAGISQTAAGSGSQQQQHAAESSAAVLKEQLLSKLVCPLTKTPLRYVAEQQQLVNDDLGVAYPVVNGVPYLMPSRGTLLQQESQTGQQAGNS